MPIATQSYTGIYGKRDDEVVRKQVAQDEKDRGGQHQPDYQPFFVALEGGPQELPDLVDDHGHSEDHPEHEAYLELDEHRRPGRERDQADRLGEKVVFYLEEDPGRYGRVKSG